MNTTTAVKAATAGTVKLTIRQWATEELKYEARFKRIKNKDKRIK